MEGRKEDIIIAALDDLEQGRSIAEVLERYPQDEAELRPILEAAVGLSGLAAAPSSQARQASRQRFLAEAQRMRESKAVEASLPPWRRFFYSFASFALFMVLLGVIVIPPSADAIPGDLLYPVKRTSESVQLYLAPAGEKEALQAEFEDERNHEVYQMLEVGRDGRAGYIGVLKEMGPDYWEIGNITAIVNESTEISGDPEVGARVEAHCWVEDGEVIAETLDVIEPAPQIGPVEP